MPSAAFRYRRSPYLMVYWAGEELVVHNYATGRQIAGSPTVVRVLSSLTTWRTPRALVRDNADYDERLLIVLLDKLSELTFVRRSDRPASRTETALATWRDWSPQASFFHLSTKDVAFDHVSVYSPALRAKAQSNPPPSPVKRVKARTRVSLSSPDVQGDLQTALLTRRTWRRFGDAAVTATQLSTLLGLTWGVQKWARTDGQGVVALKTAPSGGARHCLEAYVAVRKAEGIAPGLYHYDPDAHVLKLLSAGCSAATIASYLPQQTWYEPASALILMTAVFPRAQWRYMYARAYRSVLIEAGHFCQNFCLLATGLGLAPFCSAALADSVIERDLGIDGVTESVVYACGVGTRPPGIEWAPFPDTDDVPEVSAPKYQTRRGLRRK